ncbi:hypothetical protein [Lyngbya confervoides]|uniref:Uncharacterized protein n=1 Tax=Lyngbya confervoides BDU141951 TaxID=1574623 RepID=A0ABD4T1V7_9CYAN|nr:hypothetical protein [Lyngbya confervoides]MCM1982574.1 hypothetical protein [Lyngbya confervoides BDU141951]
MLPLESGLPNPVNSYDGVAITDQLLHCLQPLITDGEVKSILVFPRSGQSETRIAKIKQLLTPESLKITGRTQWHRVYRQECA